MLKLYKWLVYIIMKPYKNFQHLIKCLAIYFSTAKQMAERKTERKEKGAYLQRGPTSSPPAQPTSPPCRLPQAASSSVAGMPRPPRHLLSWRNPSPLDASWRRLAAAPVHSTPPHRLPPPPTLDF